MSKKETIITFLFLLRHHASFVLLHLEVLRPLAFLHRSKLYIFCPAAGSDLYYRAVFPMFLRSKFQEFMLKNRSSRVTSKQGLMPGSHSTAASPTSILEPMPFSSIRNGSRKVCKEYEEGTRAIGLGLLDVLTNEESVKSVSMQEKKRAVVFGFQLKIQIPSATESVGVSTGSDAEPQHSPMEFGIKTRNSLVPLYRSSSPARRSWIPRSEMAQSEDYTRVILHGPNPRTTHIFYDCIIEGSGIEFVDGRNCSCGDQFGYPVKDFGCSKRIDTGEDNSIVRQ